MSEPRLRNRWGHVVNLRPSPRKPFDQDAERTQLSVQLAWSVLLNAGLSHELPAVRDAAHLLAAHHRRTPPSPLAAVQATRPVPVPTQAVERAGTNRTGGGDAA